MIVNVTPSSNKGTNHFEDENEPERGRCGNILRQQQNCSKRVVGHTNSCFSLNMNTNVNELQNICFSK